MLFNSLVYLIFLPLIVLGYFGTPYRHRWWLLLAASYYFYMCWKAEYVILIIISTAIDYFCAIGIERARSLIQKRTLLMTSLFSNLGLLFTFKYLNFFSTAINDFLGLFDLLSPVPSFDFLLPVGISFYTFQTLSYTIDVYRGIQKAERHPGIFALYVTFFPQLVAGPIERSTRLLPQFRTLHHFDPNATIDGLRLILWGMFKKVVIADSAAIYVDAVYNSPGLNSGFALLIATYCYAFQIYGDFSGYSDIAIGSAKIMGYDLVRNFDQPYFSRSIPEFWKRWHISLSTWFRDYLYIPLGGNRVSTVRRCANIFIVFIVSGFWHGANTTFLVWGALHGLFFLFSDLTRNLRIALARQTGLYRYPRMTGILNIVLTFHLVCFAWIFFRSQSISDALTVIARIALSTSIEGASLSIPGLKPYDLPLILILIGLFVCVETVHRRINLARSLSRMPLLCRWSCYYGLLAIIFFCGKFDNQAFIYFQF